MLAGITPSRKRCAGLFFSVGELGGTAGPVMMGVAADITGAFGAGLILVAATMIIMIIPLLMV